MMFDKPGFHRLTTALYPEGDPLLSSDAVFGVKRSLVVVSYRLDLLSYVNSRSEFGNQKLDSVKSESEARAKGFAKGDTFKVVKHDFILQTEEEAKAVRDQFAREVGAVGL